MLTLQNQNIERELSNLLSSYLLGWKSLIDFAEWLASIDWEVMDLDSQLATILGELDLLCTEVREGLRPESNFVSKVSDLVAANESCIRYDISRLEVISSSATEVVQSPVLPFWNRSPQEVSA
jgi:hypothetical protein